MAEEIDPLTAPEVEQPQVPTIDPETVPMDQLRRAIETEIYKDQPTAWDADPGPTPDEPEPETEIAAEPETPAEPAAAAAPSDPEPEPEITPALLLARIEEAEARSKHFESLLGQRTGADGYWKRRAEQLERQMAEARPPDEIDDGESRRRLPASQQPHPAPNPSAQFIVQLAVEKALADTTGNRSDFIREDKTVDPDFAAIVQRRRPEFEAAAQTDDPMFASNQTRALMSSVWSEYDVVQKRRKREEIERRTSTNREKLLERRKVAASASPGARPPARPKQLDPMKMPIDELKKRLEQGNFR